METVIETGSVSWGTHRGEDLIPALWSELVRLSALDPNIESARQIAFERIEKETGYFGKILDGESCAEQIERWNAGEDWDSEAWILETLFETMNAICPEGIHFGSTEGDGADFGFWYTRAGELLNGIETYCEGFPVAVSCDCESGGHQEFSNSQCDSCGSNLAGSRCVAFLMTEESGPIEMGICVDCVQFHANGELPS